jgi:hypothetical protein
MRSVTGHQRTGVGSLVARAGIRTYRSAPCIHHEDERHDERFSRDHVGYRFRQWTLVFSEPMSLLGDDSSVQRPFECMQAFTAKKGCMNWFPCGGNPFALKRVHSIWNSENHVFKVGMFHLVKRQIVVAATRC